jgi:phage baseplate assembly protein W
MANMGFPFGFSSVGRTRQADAPTRVRELVEMLLFTMPGERVMRPDLGTPVMGLLFEGLNDALAAALQVSLHAALQEWLADEIEVREVTVDTQDTALLVGISYSLAGETAQHRIEFKRERG